MGHFFNFNGTAGVWRIKAINDAGGWESDTVVEDMDLSLRVYLKVNFTVTRAGVEQGSSSCCNSSSSRRLGFGGDSRAMVQASGQQPGARRAAGRPSLPHTQLSPPPLCRAGARCTCTRCAAPTSCPPR
jgi:hypothetical protein